MLVREFFDLVADALVGFLPPSLRAEMGLRRGGQNLKVWFGPQPREHYETQFVSGRVAKRPDAWVLEIGFHAEHPDVSANDDAVAKVVGAERTWRKALGDEPEPAPFLGRAAPVWRRVSELWGDLPGLEPDLAVEAAERLAAYVLAFEPVRNAAAAKPTKRAAGRTG